MANPWDRQTAVVERNPWERKEKPNYNMLDVTSNNKTENNHFIRRTREAFSNIGLEHIEEPAKAAARGTEELAANISGLLVVASDVVRPDREIREQYEDMGIDNERIKFADKVADRLKEWGSTAKDFWRDQASKGWEADVAPEIWEGGFLENPSWTRAFSLGAGAIPSMGAAITASTATGNIWTGLVLLGLVEAEPVYEEAREKGVDETKALGLFTITAGAITATEYFPMERFLKGGSGKLIKDIVIGGFIGGTQEGTQQYITNLVRKYGIDDTTDLMEGVVESIVAGVMSESIAGGVTSKKVKKVRNYIQTKINDVETKAEELGLSKEQTDEVINMVADSVVTHSDEVDNILNEEIKNKIKEREKVEEVKPAEEEIEAPEVILEQVKRTKKMVTEETLIKEKLRGREIGERKGVRKQKKTAKQQQEEVIKMLDEAKYLESGDKAAFIKILKNIPTLTETKLKEAMESVAQRIEKKGEVRQKDVLAKEITKLAVTEVPQDYRDQIDELLEGVELKRRSEKTKKRREKMSDFLERQQAEGNLTLLPKEFFDIPTKTLDEMSVEELEMIKDQIAVLSKVGETKGKLTSLKKARELNTFVSDIVKKGSERTGITEDFKAEVGVRKTDRKSVWLRSKEIISGFFASHRKVEYIMKFLNGLELTDIVREGRNKHFRLQETYYPRLGEALKKLGNLKAFTREIGLFGLTREQMVTVALNAGNQGNLRRLVKGNKLTIEQIQEIKDNLTDGEKAFVEDIFNLLEDLFPEMSNTTQRITGLSVKKIIGQYFPIVADIELSERAAFQAAKNDLFQDIFQQTYVAHTFAKARIGGADAVDLNGLSVITNHIDGVMHYIAFAEAVKDVQQVINHPRFKNMINTIYNEQVYSQFPAWLKTLANPKSVKLQGPLAGVDRAMGIIRRNATTSQLGIRITTSLVQAGSWTQTINEVGGNEAFGALQEFLTDRRGVTEFVFENSVQMRNRQRTFDRDVKDAIEGGNFKHLTQDKKTYREMLFYMIQSVDMATTLPTWLAAYNKEYNKNQNKEDSINYADHVVAITQPSGLGENLPAIMKGPEFVKIWTMFMSHFINVHNQITFALDDLKMGTDHPLRKIGNFGRRMWLAWLLPAFLTGYIKNLGDLERTLKGILLYPLGGLVIGRDIANMLIRGFGFGVPAAFGSLTELGKAVKTKDVGKKVKHAIKAVGIGTGRIPTQAVDTGTGIVDLITGETDNWLRLFFSDYAISGGKKKRRAI